MSRSVIFTPTDAKNNTGNGTLDAAGPRSFMKICCACGKIVDLDKKEMKIKKSLKKELECPACRNARISMEIDFLNGLFDGSLQAEEDILY